MKNKTKTIENISQVLSRKITIAEEVFRYLIFLKLKTHLDNHFLKKWIPSIEPGAALEPLMSHRLPFLSKAFSGIIILFKGMWELTGDATVITLLCLANS